MSDHDRVPDGHESDNGKVPEIKRVAAVAEVEEDEGEEEELTPVVLIEGFMGNSSSLYWGPLDPYNRDQDPDPFAPAGGVCRRRRRIFQVHIGCISSLHDRACEVYYQLKGGRVDYGRKHSRDVGHSRFGRSYDGLYPEWSSKKPLHFVGHSLGATTIWYLQQLLTRGWFPDNMMPEDEAQTSAVENSCDFPIIEVSAPNERRSGRAAKLSDRKRRRHNCADWMKSVTGIQATYRGSGLTNIMGQAEDNPLKIYPFTAVGVVFWLIYLYVYFDLSELRLLRGPWDFNLDHWKLSRSVKNRFVSPYASQETCFSPVTSSTAPESKEAPLPVLTHTRRTAQWLALLGFKPCPFAQSRDTALVDLALRRMERLNRQAVMCKRTFYRTFTTSVTEADPVTKRHRPFRARGASLITLFSWLMGRYEVPEPVYPDWNHQIKLDDAADQWVEEGDDFVGKEDLIVEIALRDPQKNEVVDAASQLVGGAQQGGLWSHARPLVRSACDSLRRMVQLSVQAIRKHGDDYTCLLKRENGREGKTPLPPQTVKTPAAQPRRPRPPPLTFSSKPPSVCQATTRVVDARGGRTIAEETTTLAISPNPWSPESWWENDGMTPVVSQRHPGACQRGYCRGCPFTSEGLALSLATSHSRLFFPTANIWEAPQNMYTEILPGIWYTSLLRNTGHLDVIPNFRIIAGELAKLAKDWVIGKLRLTTPSPTVPNSMVPLAATCARDRVLDDVFEWLARVDVEAAKIAQQSEVPAAVLHRLKTTRRRSSMAYRRESGPESAPLPGYRRRSSTATGGFPVGFATTRRQSYCPQRRLSLRKPPRPA